MTRDEANEEVRASNTEAALRYLGNLITVTQPDTGYRSTGTLVAVDEDGFTVDCGSYDLYVGHWERFWAVKVY